MTAVAPGLPLTMNSEPGGAGTTKLAAVDGRRVTQRYAAKVPARLTAAITAIIPITVRDNHVRAFASACVDAADGSVKRNRATARSPTRCFLSLARQPAIKARAVCGVSAGSLAKLGSLLSTLARVSLTVSPANAGTPVSISYRTQPNAQTSERLSAACPF